MSLLRVTPVQTDIYWENISANLEQVGRIASCFSEQTDLLILPETFSTGFSMNISLADTVEGETIPFLQRVAQETGVALTGSFICREGDRIFNRGFFIEPNASPFFYDKRHLFRMGLEGEEFSAGDRHLIVPYKGWKIALFICYDLRFPVWSRNQNNQYDLALYVASWPASRQRAWDILLPARAIENSAFVCGVNRVGKDGNHLDYIGGSALYNFYGQKMWQGASSESCADTIVLDKTLLEEYRRKFPTWKDADLFEFK